MSIVPLKKITFVGLAEESETITSALQDFGLVHIIEQCEHNDFEEEYSKITTKENIESLSYLINCKYRLHPAPEDEEIDSEAILEELTAMRDTRNKLLEEKEILEKKVEEVSIWGKFDFIPPEDMEGYKMWFYIMTPDKLRKIPKKTIYSVVSRDKGELYVIVLSPNKPQDMPVGNFKFGQKSLTELEDALEEVEDQLNEIKQRRLELTQYRRILVNSVNDINNNVLREETEYKSLNDGDIFIVRGYIGEHNVEEAKILAAHYGLATFIEDVADEDRAPTLLKNPEKLSGGEECVKFYSVPGYKNLDPSNVLFFSFAIFFAMILSDFGYALLLALTLFALNGKLKTSQAGRRIKTLSWFIVLTSLIWGAMVGSYFGVNPNGDGALAQFANKLKTLDPSDTTLMMKVSIYVGVGHVIIANLMNAWHHRNSSYSLSKLGWVIAGASGFIYMPMIMIGAKYPAAVTTTAQHLLMSGLIMVILFTGKSRNIFKRLLEGILGMTKISGAFGDILSYLRIFALGLASATLAIASNQLATQAIDGMPTFGYIMAIFILLVGHSINFALGIMGGVVHGLRLNVIEFFNWSISDDGYPFNAFKKQEVKKWINL